MNTAKFKSDHWKKFLILTDLEGVAGTDSFAQTRTGDSGPSGKWPSMKQLACETNACVAGIHAVHPKAQVDVIDGHGSGGLFPEDLKNCNAIPREDPLRILRTNALQEYTALLFVGQHAMAGTVDATLCHTYSSRTVLYYRLNGVFIGEFGIGALLAGRYGVPTIFLSGDDKAAMEAKMFIPSIETVITKFGTGLESAEHLDKDESCRLIQCGAEIAVRRMDKIPPYIRFQPPYELEIRHYEPFSEEFRNTHPDSEFIDDRTWSRVLYDLADILK